MVRPFARLECGKADLHEQIEQISSHVIVLLPSGTRTYGAPFEQVWTARIAQRPCQHHCPFAIPCGLVLHPTLFGN